MSDSSPQDLQADLTSSSTNGLSMVRGEPQEIEASDEEEEDGEEQDEDEQPMMAAAETQRPGRGGRATHLVPVPPPMPKPGGSRSSAARAAAATHGATSSTSRPSLPGATIQQAIPPIDEVDPSLRNTMQVQMRLDKLDVCPIQMELMVDPVRLLHEDEEEPDGDDVLACSSGPPHVISREAAERWLFKDPNKRCPLCRRRVVKMLSDVKGERSIEDVIRSLVAERFHGGDNLAHKAVKLLDPKLLVALASVLSLEETFSMLLQENDDGYIPLALLEALYSHDKVDSFLSGLVQRKTQQGAPELLYSPRSSGYGGSQCWCHELPVYVSSQFEGQDDALYTTIYAAGIEQGPGKLGPFGVLDCYSSLAPLSRQPAAASSSETTGGEASPEPKGSTEGTATDGQEEGGEAAEAPKRKRDSNQDEEDWPELPPFVPGARPPTSKQGAPGSERWGTVVVLRNYVENDRARFELCALPVRHARMKRLDEGFDDEVYEPVIRIRIARRAAKVFTGRLSARRGIWIGGAQHFDDCVLSGLPGASALLLFDPETALWRLLPGPGAESTKLTQMPLPSDGSWSSLHDARNFVVGNDPPLPLLPEAQRQPAYNGIKAPAPPATDVPPEGILLPRLAATRCKLGRFEFCLEPCFTARRYSEMAVLPQVSTTPEEAKRMRRRLVLLCIETEIKCFDPHFPKVPVISRSRELGAVLTDYVIGRGESCNLRCPEVLSVSRSHCILELQEDGENENGGRIVVYDDGSLVGTNLKGKGAVEVGRDKARPIAEGDVLQLGQEVSVRLKAVSSVLSLDDHQGLADFFERVGGRHTAQTLRSEPRLTEQIVSASLTSGNIHADVQGRDESIYLNSVLDDFEDRLW